MAALNKLTARQIKSRKKPGRLADGGGLYFCVRPNGSCGWFFMKMVNGRRPEIGLGSYPEISLAEARDLRAKCILALAAGNDPRTAIRADAGSATFGDILAELIEQKKGGWRSRHTLGKWQRTLNHYAAPLAKRSCSTISRDDVLAILRPIWSEKHVTAQTVQKHIESAMDFASVKGELSGENPARWKGSLELLLPKIRYKETHHPSLSYSETPAFAAELYKRMQKYLGGGVPRLLLFIILKGCRNSEARLSTWGEYDFERMVWTIPPEHEKTERGREVPLTRQDVDILGEPGAADELVFRAARGNRPWSIQGPIRIMDNYPPTKGFTVHGFRTTFKTWAQDNSPHPDEVSEEIIGHVVGSKVRRAYARSKMIDPMRDELTLWADYVLPLN